MIFLRTGENVLNLWKLVTKEAWQRRWRLLASVLALALALLAVILVLGSISIGNEMFHNAHERRREIGILTALGQQRRPF